MNEIIKVATLYDCKDSTNISAFKRLDPKWRHSMAGCRYLQILQDMFKFNITYITVDPKMESYVMSLLRNDSVDIFTRPLSIRSELVENVFPLQAIFTWRIGFLLRRQSEVQICSNFYWKPFTPTLWYSLFFMCILAPLVFYFLLWWEKRLVGGQMECSLLLEILLVIAGYCQHAFAVETIFTSRRIGYFTFFLFTYIIYSFYTSNLLSRLVIDEEYDMDLKTIVESGYKCAILENLVHGYGNSTDCETAMTLNFSEFETMNVSAGLEAVRSNKTALLSDFSTLYGEIYKRFTNIEICELIEIDVLSNLKKYFVSSKSFRHKELFKVGIARLHEIGLLPRMIYREAYSYTPSKCTNNLPVSLDFAHVSTPYFMLGFSYIITVIIMLGERWHFNRYRLWPYVD